jgi:hypothetical protein
MVTYSVIIIVNEELAMKQKYREVKEPRELQILAALSDGSATEEQIQEVVDDINEHLSTATGTLMNYNGRFKKAGLKALQDNYKLFTNEEYYTAQKEASVFNSIVERIIAGKQISIPPAIFNKVIDYMHGVNATDNNIANKIEYVSVPFVLGQQPKNDVALI